MAVQESPGRLRRRLQSAERRLVEKSASSGPGWRVTRVLPVLLMLTMALWIVAPAAWLVALTPWVGAAALVCAGMYLARVVLRMGHFYWQHLAETEVAATQLRSAMRQTVLVLLGTLLLAAGFFVMSSQLLGEGASNLQSRLLWALTVGGMILSLFFGELVTRLIEAVDALLLQQQDDAS